MNNDHSTAKQPSDLQLKKITKQLEDITTALNLTSEVTITDTEGVILYANDRFCELSKYSREDLIGQNHRILKSGYHSPDVYQELWDTITQGKVWNNEIKNKAKDGTYYWADSTIVPFLNDQGVPYQYVAIRKDISARKENEEMIRKLAFEDVLTNLPNRRSLEIELNKICQSKEEKFAVLLIGIDQFKLINDHYGFKTGDKVLIEVSKRLTSMMKDEKGFVSRLGVDDFVIVLKEVDHLDAVTRLAKTILHSISNQIHIENHSLYITASIGISLFPTDGDESSTLVERAGIALDKGKMHERNKYYLFTNSMDIESFKKFNLQNDIRRALENKEFFIEYQPKVETFAQQVIGAEALIRWEHPRWGIVPPNEFISIAESSGIIIKLGEWILRNVCEQMKEWNLKGLRQIPISINFSPIQFTDEKMTDILLQILDETGINPRCLEIEITENMVIGNKDDVMKKMTILANKGISFSIDDFGIGYSSLKMLNQLPFNIIKIDRSFIKDLQENEGSLHIIKALIQLAHLFEVKVVANGVENEKQLAILREQNCDYIQGYLFSHPIHPIELEKLILNDKIIETTVKEMNQTIVNRRKYFRIKFTYPLLGNLTVQSLNNKPVNVGSSAILIENIGPGGLCYVSQIKLPLNKGFVLGISIKILDQTVTLQGRNIWYKEEDHDLYQYGFEFALEESQQANLIKLLNHLQVKYKNDVLPQNSTFIKIKDKASFFQKK